MLGLDLLKRSHVVYVLLRQLEYGILELLVSFGHGEHYFFVLRLYHHRVFLLTIISLASFVWAADMHWLELLFLLRSGPENSQLVF